VIFAQAGNDIVFSGSGNDKVFARDGNDKVYAGIGNDRIYGENGNDTLLGEAGMDVLIGDNGQSGAVLGTTYADILDGGSGADILWGGIQNDTLIGGSGTDTAVYVELFSELLVQKTATGFSVTVNGNEVDQLTGVERIAANDGIYSWNVTTETWSKISNKSGIELAAEAGKVYSGTIGADVVNFVTPNFAPAPFHAFYMNAGDDSLTLSQLFIWNEVAIYGGDGNDTLKAQSNFIVAAHIDGGKGNDKIQGSNGDDSLLGGSGNDILEGRIGDDVMSGGAGADTFAFAILASPGSTYPFINSSSGKDVITDFVVGTDKLVLDATSTKSIVDTAAGLQVNLTYDVASYSPTGVMSVIQETATVLLRGVHGQYDLTDLMLA
jgi:Ca2+-binding RTX toxin-like protein